MRGSVLIEVFVRWERKRVADPVKGLLYLLPADNDGIEKECDEFEKSVILAC